MPNETEYLMPRLIKSKAICAVYHPLQTKHMKIYITGLVQDCSKSTALELAVLC